MDISIRSFFLRLLPNFSWDIRIFGNPLLNYAEAIVAFFGFLLFLKIIQNFFFRLFRVVGERREDIAGIFVSILNSIKPPFYFFLSFYFAIQYLSFNAFAKKVIDVVLLVWIVYQVVYALHIFFDVVIRRKLVKDSDKEGKHTAEILSTVAKISLWIVGFLFVLSNMGVQITSLLAGLGIGGIAVAFAMQSILSDIFSSFAIYFDKPFKVGDWIMIGTDEGIVEKIGLKTTRIKSVNGEQLVVSNKELTSSRVQNYEGISERRVLLSIGIAYDTDPKMIRRIPEIFAEIIESVPKTRFVRAHLKKFSDFSLVYEVSYFVKETEYAKYAAVQNEVHAGIVERFRKEKIRIPYPTQTVELTKTDS